MVHFTLLLKRNRIKISSSSTMLLYGKRLNFIYREGPRLETESNNTQVRKWRRIGRVAEEINLYKMVSVLRRFRSFRYLNFLHNESRLKNVCKGVKRRTRQNKPVEWKAEHDSATGGCSAAWPCWYFFSLIHCNLTGPPETQNFNT